MSLQVEPQPSIRSASNVMEIPFTKMHGIGNDFVFVDRFRVVLADEDLAEFARATCDRRYGIGADGLILVEPIEALMQHDPTRPGFRMRMLNPDGSVGGMCGNGVRCMAKFLADNGYISGSDVEIAAADRLLHLVIQQDGRVCVDMGVAALTRGEIGIIGEADESFLEQPVGEYIATAVGMGNPHIVIFVDDVDSVDLTRVGPILEHHESFRNRTNVHFAQPTAHGLKMRTWERGAGITLACGSGACSVGVAGFLTGRSGRDVIVSLPGGDLHIEYREDGRVFMTGPAETSFEGVWLGKG